MAEYNMRLSKKMVLVSVVMGHVVMWVAKNEHYFIIFC